MRRKEVLFSVAILLMGSVAGALFWLKAHQRLGRPGVRLELPEKVLEYQSVPVKVTDIELQELPKDTSFARRQYFRGANGRTNYLQLGIVLMGTDRTSIHNPQFCLTGQGWQIRAEELTRMRVERPQPYDLPLHRMTGRGTLRYTSPDGALKELECSAQYVFWFVADGRLTAAHGQRMWWMAKDLVTTGVLPRWAYVSVMGVCEVGLEDALFEEIKRFLAAAVPEFQIAGPEATDPASPPRSGP